ncbi:MAG: hypothetical protein J5J00_05245 [Deltaproteobacteria bacterium]|nr:hypothetical protein [Deltaproteobacteria bacterium]
MLTGMLNSENLSSVLRGISQKRQNGLMEISFPDGAVTVVFSAGKVVDFIDPVSPGCSEVMRRLSNAGYGEEIDDVGEMETYSDLFRALNNRSGEHRLVDEETFKKVIRHRILDRLYMLNLDHSAIYSFKIQMPEYDRDFSPAISVGQILLDRVALETDGERFVKRFKPGCMIALSTSGGDALSEEEQAVFAALDKPRTLEELRSRLILSCYHFQSALLSLFDRAALDVNFPESATNQASELSCELVNALEESTERPYIASDQLKVEPEFEPNGQPQETARQDDPLTSRVLHVTSPAASGAPKSVGPVVNLTDEGEEGEGLAPSFLTILNVKLLNSNAVPNTSVILLLAAAVVVAVGTWGKYLKGF